MGAVVQGGVLRDRPEAGAWLALHCYQDFLYSGDRQFPAVPRLRFGLPGGRVWVGDASGASPALRDLDDGLLELDLAAGSRRRISPVKQPEG